MEKIEALEKVGKNLLLGEKEAAKTLINEQYPFRHIWQFIRRLELMSFWQNEKR